MPVKSRGRFHYEPRSQEQMSRRANQSGSSRESFLKDTVKTWTPATGKNRVRFMPPTFDNPEHYGVDCWVHYSIGPDGNAFACLNHLDTLGYENQDCPICRAKAKADRNGDEELANALKPNKRVLTYIIDRNKPQDGPLVWAMPWTLDRAITQRCLEEEENKTYNIDDPEAGNDVRFNREGKEQLTKYTNETIVAKSTPLSDDEREQDDWIKYIVNNPLTDIVVIPDPEVMQEALAGGVGRRNSRDRDDDRRSSRRSRDEDEDEPPRRSSRRSRDEDDEDEPRRFSRRFREDDDDEPPRRSSRRARDEDDEEESSSRRSSRRSREDDDDEPPRRGSRRRDEDEDEPPRSSSRRSRDEDDDEPPRRSSRRTSEEDEEPARRSSRRDDDEDERPRLRRGSRNEDADDEEETTSKKDKARSGTSGTRSTSSSNKASRDEDEEDEPRQRRQEMRDKVSNMRNRR